MDESKRKNASKNNPTIKKNKWLKVRLSDSDFEAVHTLADRTGLSISELIRLRLFGDGTGKVIDAIVEEISTHLNNAPKD